jgi:hypothetical protein
MLLPGVFASQQSRVNGSFLTKLLALMQLTRKLEPAMLETPTRTKRRHCCHPKASKREKTRSMSCSTLWALKQKHLPVTTATKQRALTAVYLYRFPETAIPVLLQF